MRVLTVAAVAVVVIASVAGCSSPITTVDSAGKSPPNAVIYHGHVPSFSGPWSAEFTAAYRSTTSSLDHKILAKGRITDQDYAAVGSVFVSCMSAHGYQVTLGAMVDTFSIHSPGLTDAQLKAQSKALTLCQKPFEAVSALYLQMLQNPQNEDMNALVTQCLVKNKVAAPDFTVAQYKADLETQKFPFNIDSPAANACIVSPLGLSVSQIQR